jgi:glyoxylase-like metal-dependent hydrolase (beta-lactamase superfamily II)
LVGEALAVDAGALASGLPLAAQRRVRAVLLTHRHFDHLRELPLFLDNVCAARLPPVAIGAEKVTLAALFRHVFNDVLWPDVRRFRPPPAEFFTVRPEEEFPCQGLKVLPIRLHHTAPSLGYLFRRGGSVAAVLGDTGFHQPVFERLTRIPGLRFLLIEVSYPRMLSRPGPTSLPV